MKAKTGMYLFLLLLFHFTYSCKKIQVAPTEEIVGHWKWVFSYNSMPYEWSTPQNTGVQEIFVYNSNLTWLKIQNNVHIDSGTYSIGKGSFRAPTDTYTFHYDSIVFYRDGIQIRGMEEYYKIYGDTLIFGQALHDQIYDPYAIRPYKCFAREH